MRFFELRFVEIGPAEVRALEMGAREIGPCQDRLMKIGTPQLGAAQIRLRQICVAEVAAVERYLDRAQIGVREYRADMRIFAAPTIPHVDAPSQTVQVPARL